MAPKELKDLTIEELKKRSRFLKVVNWFTIGILLVLLGVTIYYSIRKNELQIPVFVIILGVLGIVLLNFRGIQKINSEINRRKQQ